MYFLIDLVHKHQTSILTHATLRLILPQSFPYPAHIALYKYIYSLKRTRYQVWYAAELLHLLVVRQISQGKTLYGKDGQGKVEASKSLMDLLLKVL